MRPAADRSSRLASGAATRTELDRPAQGRLAATRACQIPTAWRPSCPAQPRRAHPRPPPTYLRLGAYATAGGTREVAAAYDPDWQLWVLADALERTQTGELDARIVDDAIESPDEARALATDYLLHAAGAGRPLVS